MKHMENVKKKEILENMTAKTVKKANILFEIGLFFCCGTSIKGARERGKKGFKKEGPSDKDSRKERKEREKTKQKREKRRKEKNLLLGASAFSSLLLGGAVFSSSFVGVVSVGPLGGERRTGERRGGRGEEGGRGQRHGEMPLGVNILLPWKTTTIK